MRRTSIREFGITSKRRIAAEFSGIFLLLILLLWHSWYGPDIWYHLTWGRSLVENFSFLPVTRTLIPQPVYANTYWLFQIVMYGLMSAGSIYALSVFFLVLWLAIAWSWMRQTGAVSTPFWGPLLFLMFVCVVQTRFESRPEILSFLFLTWIIGLTARPAVTKRHLVLLFILEALWANVHGFFVLGPCVGLAMAVSCLWNREKPVSLGSAGLRFVALSAGSLVSPFGIGNWRQVIDYAGVGRALRGLNWELMPPGFFSLSWPLILFSILWPIVAVFALFRLVKRRSSFAALLALAGVAMALQAERNQPLFWLLSAPLLGDLLAILRVKTPPIPKRLALVPSAWAFVIALTVVTGSYHRWVSSLGTFGVHLESSAFPVETTNFLRSIGFEGRIFSDSYDGGYLEYHLPRIQVAGDSYFSDAGATLTFFAAIRKPEVMRELDNRFHFDALLINIENQEVIDSLWNDPKWKPAFADSHRILYFQHPTEFNWSEALIYTGQDLRHWTYKFGALTWAEMAFKHGDRDLMYKVAADLLKARKVPTDAVRLVELFAEKTQDKGLAEMAFRLEAKSF